MEKRIKITESKKYHFKRNAQIMTKKTLSNKKKGNVKFAIEIMDNTEEGGIKGEEKHWLSDSLVTIFFY